MVNCSKRETTRRSFCLFQRFDACGSCGCFDGIFFLPSTILRTRKSLRAAVPRRSAPGNQVADDLSCRTQTPDFKGASEKAFRRSTRNSISFLSPNFFRILLMVKQMVTLFKECVRRNTVAHSLYKLLRPQ